MEPDKISQPETAGTTGDVTAENMKMEDINAECPTVGSRAEIMGGKSGVMNMKKHINMILLITLMTALSGCTAKQEKDKTVPQENASLDTLPEKQSITVKTDQPNQEENSSEQNNILIAYFTWAENAKSDEEADVVSSASVRLPGNVGQIASWIQQETGGSLFSIQVEAPYSTDYDRCLDRAADEKAEKASYTAPMAVFSFIEENDLSGKKIVLFCPHGTGELASSGKDITAVLPDSDIEENVLGIYCEETTDAEETVQKWLREIGY